MDNRNEQISALMDEELNGTEQQQAIDLLLADKTARRAWAEYHIIREHLQHSAEVAPTPKHNIRQWLNKLPINDERYSAAIAASFAIVVFTGLMFWGSSSNRSVESVAVENPTVMQIENPALTSEVNTQDGVLSIINRDEYYQQTYRQAVDMDGLKQVSYSFE
ncbi:MAG: sigma-E factor negative regulatory protein [Neisseriaceae bacterium]|nr:sigma-E factor negative regulatory protein [Neisseriaceae bacterium]